MARMVPLPGLAAYSIAKYAIRGLSEGAALVDRLFATPAID
jgi:NAD(P)-dependent dehydrogenase (short-subunit alcohol dehydrogenase family)